MTTHSPQGAQPADRAGRLVELLERLGSQGISQSQVARRTGVPTQYLSDVRNERRPLTELFARRLAEEFDVNFRWLLGEEESSERPALSEPSFREATSIPMMSAAIVGRPQSHPEWRGAQFKITGLAAAKAATAELPYILQLSHDAGRLRKGDLVLVSQSISETAELSIVRCGKEILIAEKKGAKWLRAATHKPLLGKCDIAGHLVATLWSALT